MLNLILSLTSIHLKCDPQHLNLFYHPPVWWELHLGRLRLLFMKLNIHNLTQIMVHLNSHFVLDSAKSQLLQWGHYSKLARYPGINRIHNYIKQDFQLDLSSQVKTVFIYIGPFNLSRNTYLPEHLSALHEA